MRANDSPGPAASGYVGPLSVEAARARELVAALLAAGVDDEESIDLSLSSETDLKEAVEEKVRQLAELEALVEAVERRALDLASRKARLRSGIASIRGALAVALESVPGGRLRTVEGTVYLVRPRAGVRITDPAALPAEYVRTEVETYPDKAAIGRALAAGVDIPGATLANGAPSVGIRP